MGFAEDGRGIDGGDHVVLAQHAIGQRALLDVGHDVVAIPGGTDAKPEGFGRLGLLENNGVVIDVAPIDEAVQADRD